MYKRALILCVYSLSQHGEPLSPAASTLAMVLTRGLSMEQQKSSRDSLQYSSGYSTQTNTPSCSEDTIPSQGTETPVLLEHIYSMWTPWGNVCELELLGRLLRFEIKLCPEKDVCRSPKKVGMHRNGMVPPVQCSCNSMSLHVNRNTQ